MVILRPKKIKPTNLKKLNVITDQDQLSKLPDKHMDIEFYDPTIPRTNYSRWFDASDVIDLKISDNLLGQGYYGKVYSGKIKFKNGSVQRCAIKRFKNPRIMSEYAEVYEKVISELSCCDVTIPKMGVVRYKLESGGFEYVLVSQLFGNSKESRLTNLLDKRFFDLGLNQTRAPPLLSSILSLKNLNNIVELAEMWSKVLHAGYFPTADMFLYLPTNKGLETIPLDLDLMVGQKIHGIRFVEWQDKFFKDLFDFDAQLKYLQFPENSFRLIRFFIEELIKRMPEEYAIRLLGFVWAGRVDKNIIKYFPKSD